MTTSLLAADQSEPSPELLEFLAEGEPVGKDWVDPLTIQEMDETDTTTPNQPTSAPRGKQP